VFTPTAGQGHHSPASGFGVRHPPSEALELQWQDIAFGRQRTIFRESKNGDGRVAALPPAAIVCLSNIPYTHDEKKTRSGQFF
jgi:integrase